MVRAPSNVAAWSAIEGGIHVRELADLEGRRWDATIGKESWGTLLILFVPRDGGVPRKSVLLSESPFDAEREFDAMDEEELRARLSAAQPWT